MSPRSGAGRASGINDASLSDAANGMVDSTDSLDATLHLAQLSPLSHAVGCPEIGQTVNVLGGSSHTWGDVNCDGVLSPADTLWILRFVANLSLIPVVDCPAIGTGVQIS